MEVSQLQRQLIEYTESLLREGYLDSQFTELKQLQDETNPGFVMEVITLFFEETERIIHDLNSALQVSCPMIVNWPWSLYSPILCTVCKQQVVDFKKVGAHVHQLKGSSSSIGAQKVKNACVQFRRFCEVQNADGCRACLQQVNQEYFLVKIKLQTLLSMEQQIVSAGGSIPVVG